ncbi:MAG TPA: 1-acyl-sn-glycerol-3-phosphate acyltransferase [Isosphaeraceae bacterium]|jgi:acyl-[acyl-carrier-protein]-phospholipid O-acyltransferase/long-chain-fatty-acid--[acyl-carrier-protein] ligase|nr:1-acyl-sn-glycerol-3-phosphate acyltransferase [Isosphaeraceae bacterium]
MSWLHNFWLAVLAAAMVGAIGFFVALPWVIQPILRVLLWPRYRLKLRGLEHLPRQGPALLAVNHVSWIDGFLLAAACPRRGRVLVNADYLSLPVVRSLARRSGMIPVPAFGPRAQRAAIAAVRAALDSGQVAALFPEAQITRNGLLGPFYRGLEVILADRDQIPVIPVYFDNLWGSLFSFSGGRFLWKRPQGLRRTVGIAFGPPVTPPITVFAVRQAVLAAGVQAFELRDRASSPLETLDPSLPRLEHPTLGLLAASTADFHSNNVHQVGHKPDTVGHPVPGVALRVVNAAGDLVSPDTEGPLEALLAGQPAWVETGLRARIDRDGFVQLA